MDPHRDGSASVFRQSDDGDGRLELLSGLRRHEDWAYECLVRELQDPLLRFFLVSHRDVPLAREQVVETFSNLLAELPRMNGGRDSLRGFVFGVARNVLRRSWRTSSRDSRRRETIDRVAGGAGSAETVLDRILLREEVGQAMDLLAELESPQREIAQLRFLEEFSIGEIAEALDLPAGTIKSHIHRIRADLSNAREKGTRDG